MFVSAVLEVQLITVIKQARNLQKATKTKIKQERLDTSKHLAQLIELNESCWNYRIDIICLD